MGLGCEGLTCCEACAVGFHTAPSWKPADHMMAIDERACSCACRVRGRVRRLG